MGHDGRIHGAGTGAADAFEIKPSVFQQLVQHTPGERAVGATALQSQVDGLPARFSKKQRCLLRAVTPTGRTQAPQNLLQCSIVLDSWTSYVRNFLDTATGDDDGKAQTPAFRR